MRYEINDNVLDIQAASLLARLSELSGTDALSMMETIANDYVASITNEEDAAHVQWLVSKYKLIIGIEKNMDFCLVTEMYRRAAHLSQADAISYVYVYQEYAEYAFRNGNRTIARGVYAELRQLLLEEGRGRSSFVRWHLTVVDSRLAELEHESE